jgi:GntR family transcriptional repressor for pyruvate dehydrogenase complex
VALARMAKNPVYESVMQTVYDNIQRYFDRFLPRQEDILKENYQDLCEIIKAVEERQASKASLLVQGHVYKFNRLMENRARKAKARLRVSQKK